MPRTLAVKLTYGAEAPERASQALTVATSALLAGAPVSLWLTGEAVWFATTDRVPDLGLAHATSVADLMATLSGPTGAEISVCSQCAARRRLTDADLAPGAAIRGAMAFTELVLRDDVQALVY